MSRQLDLMASLSPAVKRSSRDEPMALAELIKQATAALERGVGLAWISGEIVEWKRAASGHVYFSLRDRTAGVSAVMWGRDAARLGARLVVKPGDHVLVRGRLGIFERDGRMQFYADHIELMGAGAAAQALEELKRKLAGEGLFEVARKRPLPHVPGRIGVVTSASGAAVQDILRTVARRFPRPVLIGDCAVQGALAPGQIVAAIGKVAPHVDVLIIGRGGGASMDLAAFNHERVVRAIAACPVPTVSAVGHEVDVTLSDLVADVRASTPTAAAELVVPVRDELAAQLRKEQRRMHREMVGILAQRRELLDRALERQGALVAGQLSRARQRWFGEERRLVAQHPRSRLLADRKRLLDLVARLERHAPNRMLRQHRETLTRITAQLEQAAGQAQIQRRRADMIQWQHRADQAMTALVHRRRVQFAEVAARLHALSPLAVLDRGYAVVRQQATGAVVRSVRAVSPGQDLRIAFCDGEVVARASTIAPRGETP